MDVVGVINERGELIGVFNESKYAEAFMAGLNAGYVTDYQTVPVDVGRLPTLWKESTEAEVVAVADVSTTVWACKNCGTCGVGERCACGGTRAQLAESDARKRFMERFEPNGGWADDEELTDAWKAAETSDCPHCGIEAVLSGEKECGVEFAEPLCAACRAITIRALTSDEADLNLPETGEGRY